MELAGINFSDFELVYIHVHALCADLVIAALDVKLKWWTGSIPIRCRLKMLTQLATFACSAAPEEV